MIGQTNICAPMGGEDANGVVIQPMRKAAFAEIFLMYFIYLVINAISSLQNQSSMDPPKPANDDAQGIGQRPGSKSSFIDPQPLNDFYPIFFGYHVVALGFAIMYSPYTFTVIIAYLHFVGYVIILLAHKFDKPNFTVPAYAWSQFMNLLLIGAGIVGISYTSSC